jgi:hypothetical protein
MTIKTITYQRLVSFGSFQNATVGATAEVGVGDNADAAMETLAVFVEGAAKLAVSRHGQIADDRDELQQLQWRKEEAQREVFRLTNDATRLKAFLAKHGIDPGEETPF